MSNPVPSSAWITVHASFSEGGQSLKLVSEPIAIEESVPITIEWSIPWDKSLPPVLHYARLGRT